MSLKNGLFTVESMKTEFAEYGDFLTSDMKVINVKKYDNPILMPQKEFKKVKLNVLSGMGKTVLKKC